MLTEIKHRLFGAELAIIHEFHKPPYGGGNQFLLALKRQLTQMGKDVGANTVGKRTKTVLFNSFNFDFERLRKLPQSRLRMIHRVDGPIGVYRGKDDGTDQKIWQINHEIADLTVFQSQYSLNKHKELGMEFKNPVVISNAADPNIFHPRGRTSFHQRVPEAGESRVKIRVIAAAWSDNPRKGGPIYQWLDEDLDRSRYTFTFVGRIQSPLKHAHCIPAVPSEQLADLLRSHDIYITASQDDPCSNALIEALSCGLPAIFLHSGGHPELVKKGGLAFRQREEIPGLLDHISQRYVEFQSQIEPPRLSDIAEQYWNIVMA